MNQTQLRLFVAAAESRSFTKTAEQFFITQAAVTQHIQALEATLGCELFDRRRRPMQLTASGKSFYEDAKQILHLMSAAASAQSRSFNSPRRFSLMSALPETKLPFPGTE